MDAIIRIQVPNAVLTLKMATTAGDTIVARISVYIQTANQWTANIVIDCNWPTVFDWERNMRSSLNQIINGKDAIVEGRIKMPRYTDATETERRARGILCQILGIPER